MNRWINNTKHYEEDMLPCNFTGPTIASSSCFTSSVEDFQHPILPNNGLEESTIESRSSTRIFRLFAAIHFYPGAFPTAPISPSYQQLSAHRIVARGRRYFLQRRRRLPALWEYRRDLYRPIAELGSRH